MHRSHHKHPFIVQWCAMLAALAVAIAPALASTTAAYADDTVEPTPLAPTAPQSDVVVAAFQQSWNTVKQECQQIYGPSGVGYVQISTPSESVTGTEWWTADQPVSYRLHSRFGMQQELEEMINACNAAGVAVIADVELNHTSANNVSWIEDQLGVADTTYNGTYGKYPGFTGGIYQYKDNGNDHQYGIVSDDFHRCTRKVANFTDAQEVWNCRVQTRWDLNTGSDRIQEIQAEYLASLWKIGVRGFRISSAKYIDPADIAAVKTKLAAKIGVPVADLLFIQDVVYHDNEAAAIQPDRYTSNGRVLEYKYAYDLLAAFSGSIHTLRTIHDERLSSQDAQVFIANWETERGSETLKASSGARYEMANAFILADSYGTPTLLSSYYFDEANTDSAPKGSTDIRVPDVNMSTQCASTKSAASQWTWGSWYCQPYWTSTRGMIGFHNAVAGTQTRDWQELDASTIGFARGSEGEHDKGFFALNNTLQTKEVTFTTSLPDGIYCNVYTTRATNCAEEHRVTVQNGSFTAQIAARSALAIHVGALYDSTADPVQDGYEPGYVDSADLSRIADRTTTVYYHAPDASAAPTLVIQGAQGEHSIPMSAVANHDGWYVAEDTEQNIANMTVHIDGGADVDTQEQSIPVGATQLWIENGEYHMGVPFITGTAQNSTQFTVHVPTELNASGIRVYQGDSSTYYPFEDTDSLGYRLTVPVQEIVDSVDFTIVADEHSETPVEGTADRYTAQAGVYVSMNDTVIPVRGAIETWINSAGELSHKSPELANPSGIAQPNDQKNPQELEVIVHYHRPDGHYQDYDLTHDQWSGWDMWTWIREGSSGGLQQFTEHDDFGEITRFSLIENEKGVREPGFIIRQGGDAWLGKDPDDNDRHIPESAIQVDANQREKGRAEIWLIAGDPTIYTYEPSNIVHVTFDGNGGPLKSSVVDVKYGEQVTQPEVTMPEGSAQQFIGWTVDKEGKEPYDFTQPVTANMTLYAKWANADTQVHTVTLHHHMGTSDTKSTFYVEDGDDVTLPKPSREGYRFNGWWTAAQDGTKVESSITVKDDTQLHAQWVKVWTVAFDTGEDADLIESRTVDHGSVLDLSKIVPTRPGYTHTGWFVRQADGSTIAHDPEIQVRSNMILVAQWQKNGTYWTIRFDLNGGTIPDSAKEKLANQRILDGAYATRPDLTDEEIPTRAGYEFIGWSTVKNDALGLSLFQFEKQPIDRNGTLYALWKQVE